MKKLERIGTTELLSLVDHNIPDIPAKIDTGADSSAIWASNIHLEGNRLVFNFFAPGSVYYQKMPVSTTAYRATSVKNSFGHSEFRYKTKLKIKVGGHTLTRWFSLANRSRNHYPVLLGKNFLKQRFLVDVSSQYLFTREDDVKAASLVTVISSRTDQPVDNFFKNVEKELKVDCKIDLVHYNELAFWFGKEPKITNLKSGKALDNSKIVYIKNYKKFTEQAVAITQYATYRNIVVRDEELEDAVSLGKLSETMRLNCYGLPVPKGVSMATEQFISNADMVIDKIGLPLVLKDIFSDRGKNNYLIESKKDFLKILKDSSDDCYFIAQKFIPNDGFTRVIVLGKETALAIKRTSATHKEATKAHLNKPKGGTNATLLEEGEVDGALSSLAANASEVMRRQVAGVDLIKDIESNRWYILEVNYNPEMVSASFTDKKVKAFAQFIKQELEKW